MAAWNFGNRLNSTYNLERPGRPRRGGRAVDGSGLENRHTRKGIGGSNPSLSASESIESITCIESSQHILVSGQTRGYLALKGTGEHSPTQITARKFNDFSVRDVAGPLSCRSEIEPNKSKLGLCRRTNASDGELETESQRIAEPRGHLPELIRPKGALPQNGGQTARDDSMTRSRL
jgi:hypothetical protein